MVWVFGIVFLTLVVTFAVWLHRNSSQNQQILTKLPRNRRILFGVLGCLLSFASAYAALNLSTTVQNWDHPPFDRLLGVLILMFLFVVLQVISMLCFVSLITGTETEDDSKRS